MSETAQLTEKQDKWLTRSLIPLYRSTSILCIIGILTRRFYLSGVIPVPVVTGTLVTVLRVAENFIELFGLFGAPVELLLWFRLVGMGYLAKPKLLDYALLLMLYVTAVGYLPPPGSHGALHFGS